MRGGGGGDWENVMRSECFVQLVSVHHDRVLNDAHCFDLASFGYQLGPAGTLGKNTVKSHGRGRP